MRTIIFSRVAAVAALAVVGTSARAADAEKSFVHEGYTYNYTTSRDDAGRTVIKGQRLPDHTGFRLVVAQGRVSGQAGDQSVSFRVNDAKGAAAGASGTMLAMNR